jgi:hypothetical protein
MSYSHDWTQPPRPPRPPWSRESRFSSVPDGQLRVSDLERTEITNALCRHFADGRLDEGEFNERMEKATRAKTRDDLGPLLADLPRLGTGAGTGVSTGAGTGAPHAHRHVPSLLLIVVVGILIASALPITFMAWHAHWLIIAVLALFVLVRHDRRHRIRP